MNSPAAAALIICAVVTAMLEAFDQIYFGRKPARGKPWPRPALAVGMIISAGIMAVLGTFWWREYEGGPSLLALTIAAIPVFLAGVKTDLKEPATKRHFFGTIVGAFVLFIGGFGIPYIGLPGGGTVSLGYFASLLLTLFWVFIVVGIVEICSLLPLAAGGVGLLIGLMVFLPVHVRETFPGLAISGILAGGVIGHVAGIIIKAHSRPPEKSDILVLGFFCAAATLSTFLKSVTLTGFILPLSLLIVVVIMLGMRSFERSLLLRASPRD